MNGSYMIYPEAGLVVYKISGLATWPEIRQLWIDLTRDPDFRAEYKGLGDWREAENGLTREDVYEMADFVVTREATSGNWVILVEEPMMTAFAVIYRERVGDQHEQEICCTVAGASKELGLDLRPYLF